MTALKFVALLALLAAVPIAAHASQGPPYGSNCQGACGIGSNIIVNSIACHLVDTTGADLPGPVLCGTSINDINPATLPANYDGRSIAWSWSQTSAASCVVVAGAILEASDRTISEYASGSYTKSTTCRVVVHTLVPAAADGSGQLPMAYYIGGSTDGSTTWPGGTNPGANYGLGWSTYPGPQCISSGPPCHFNVFTPNPNQTLPMQWSGIPIGKQSAWVGTSTGNMTATMIPIYFTWNGGNATTLAGLGACGSAQTNMVGHTYTAGGFSAPELRHLVSL